MTEQDHVKKVRRLMRKAVDAHQPIFNGEMRPSEFQERDAKAAIKAAYDAVDELVAYLKSVNPN